MIEDFNDFLDKNIADYTKNAGCSEFNQGFVKELIIEEFENFKADLKNKNNSGVLLERSIEKNNVLVFKEILSNTNLSLSCDNLVKIILNKCEKMFEYLVENQSTRLNTLCNYDIFIPGTRDSMHYLKCAIKSNFVNAQKYIVDNFINDNNRSDAKDVILDQLENTQDFHLISNILTSPGLASVIDINDVYVRNKNYLCEVIRSTNRAKNWPVFQLLMSDELIHPVDIKKDNYQALFYCVLNFFEETGLKNCPFFNHFLYDKQVQIDENFISRFDKFETLQKELKDCVAKRDLFLKMDKEFDESIKIGTQKIKI